MAKTKYLVLQSISDLSTALGDRNLCKKIWVIFFREKCEGFAILESLLNKKV